MLTSRFRPIILLGAARSGTKALRDALGCHPALTAVPHDVNFVWKFGNYSVSHDELGPEHARPEVIRYIHGFLAKYGRDGCRVVEKTVSNALRVPFVRAVVPDAVFVHLLRDGREVVESAMRMWRAPLEQGRLLDKLRDVPIAALPIYARQYLQRYLRRRWLGQAQLESWGPRFVGIDEEVRQRPLLEVCALQWRRCVESASAALIAGLEAGSVCEVRYERLVMAPEAELRRLYAFLELSASDDVVRRSARALNPGNLGKWRYSLTAEERHRLDQLLGPILLSLSYETDPPSRPTGLNA